MVYRVSRIIPMVYRVSRTLTKNKEMEMKKKSSLST